MLAKNNFVKIFAIFVFLLAFTFVSTRVAEAALNKIPVGGKIEKDNTEEMLKEKAPEGQDCTAPGKSIIIRHPNGNTLEVFVYNTTKPLSGEIRDGALILGSAFYRGIVVLDCKEKTETQRGDGGSAGMSTVSSIITEIITKLKTTTIQMPVMILYGTN